MDPVLQQLFATLQAKFEAQKSAQAAVAPLETAAAEANAALSSGKELVTTATSDTDAALAALGDYIHGGPAPTPDPAEPTARAARKPFGK